MFIDCLFVIVVSVLTTCSELQEKIQYKSTEKTEEIEAVVSALKIKGKKLEGDEYFRDVMEREKKEALLSKEEVEIQLKVDLEDVQHTKDELLKVGSVQCALVDPPPPPPPTYTNGASGSLAPRPCIPSKQPV